MSANVIMIQGTNSDAGKTLVVAGLCRYFANKGLKVFPFKSQNMASNSYLLPTGEEMSRAQALQAEAAKRAADVRMNPILLKPVADARSQVYVTGVHTATLNAVEYYDYKPLLKSKIQAIFDQVAQENDLVIIEGAGSPAEINLNRNDFVNMGMAAMAKSPVILVADIDRGGVFAAIYGTIKLLDSVDRARIKGIIINKFRGDIRLLQDGLDQIETLTGVSVIGVIPYLDLQLESEDSLALHAANRYFDQQKDLDIAILELPHLKNFSDFNGLSIYQDVSVRYVDRVSDLGQPDLLIIPDTQNAIGSVECLSSKGWGPVIRSLVDRGGHILALGMGGHLLTESLVLSDGTMLPGLGILSGISQIFPHIQVRENHLPTANLCGRWAQVGQYPYGPTLMPFIEGDNFIDGLRALEGRVVATGFIALFEQVDWTRAYLNALRKEKGLAPYPVPQETYSAFKDRQYDRLADRLAYHLDMAALSTIIKQGETSDT